VLRDFADRLNEVLRRGTDWIARVGGEEFAVVLPEATLPEAEVIAQRLQERIRTDPFETASAALRVTTSLGLCSLNPDHPDSSALHEIIIKIADAALYESKRAGRDRLTIRRYPAPEGTGGEATAAVSGQMPAAPLGAV
jgi:diguanylate cyclase (GGDEF)-like protein